MLLQMGCWGGVKNEGGGRSRQRLLTAQLLRATKFCAVPSNRSSERYRQTFLPVTTPSERQISPATRTGKSIEVLEVKRDSVRTLEETRRGLGEKRERNKARRYPPGFPG